MFLLIISVTVPACVISIPLLHYLQNCLLFSVKLISCLALTLKSRDYYANVFHVINAKVFTFIFISYYSVVLILFVGVYRCSQKNQQPMSYYRLKNAILEIEIFFLGSSEHIRKQHTDLMSESKITFPKCKAMANNKKKKNKGEGYLVDFCLLNSYIGDPLSQLLT